MLGTIETRDGARLTVRSIEPGDKKALTDTFEHLSPESVYRRFLRPLKHLTTRDLAYLTELDHRDHEALVAIGAQDQIVAVARYIRDSDDPAKAEVAVTVRDDWQRRGVGTQLLALLAERARSVGVERFTGICLAENQEMLRLFEELGPTIERGPEFDAITVEVELPTTATEAIRPAMRAAAIAWERRGDGAG